MTSFARILLAAGLLVAIVTAAPQQPTHPLSSAQNPSSVAQTSSPIFSHAHDSDDSSQHEADDTQNDDSTTIAPQRSGSNPQPPFSSIHRQTRQVASGTQSDDSDGATTTTEGTQRFASNPQSAFIHRQTRQAASGTQSDDESDDDTVTTTQGSNFHPLSSFSNGRHTRSSTFPKSSPALPGSPAVPATSFGHASPVAGTHSASAGVETTANPSHN